MNFYRALLSSHPLANVAFVVVLVMGLLAYRGMPREQDPEINFNWLAVVSTLPGAAAGDVERKVTQPLEEALARIGDIRFISSTSREGVSSILVRFRDIPEYDFDRRVTDLRREVQTAAKRDLPPEANEPVVTEITTNNGFPSAMLLLEGAANDEALRDAARRLKVDLERMSGVDNVLATGLSDPELRVTLRPSAMAARGLDAGDVADSVAHWFQDTPAGRVRVGEEEWLLRVFGQEVSPEHLARLTVFPSMNPAQQTPLEDVAELARAREKPTTLVSRQGHPAVLLAVTKKSRVNTLELVERVNDYIVAQNQILAGSGLRLSLLDDQTIPTRQSISVMQNNALQGLAFVFLLSWLFLGSRMAFLTSLGIPFSLAGTFWILSLTGNTLNMTVLLGAIIALGMLVDDAVVILEDIYYRMARGAAALEAATLAVTTVGLPVLASVLTTMAAFLPLMLLPGIVGKFMMVVPLVVTLALAVSLVEAFWMLPTHVATLQPDFTKPSRLHAWRTRFTHGLRVKYARLLLLALRHAWFSAALIGTAFVLAFLAVGGGWVKQNFFAMDPIRIFYVNLDMPPGTALDVTLRQTEQLERAVASRLREGELRAAASYAGLKFTDTEPLYGDAHGQVAVSLLPRAGGFGKVEGRATDVVVEDMRREIEALRLGGHITFFVVSGGPPAQKPVKARLRGDDYARLRQAADELKAVAARIPGIRDLADDDLPGRRELVLRVDAAAVRAAGLDPARVARLVRLHAEGEIVAVARDRGEKIEVRVRGPERNLDDIQAALADPVALPGGGSTTLASLVHSETHVAKGVIKRYDLRRAITVEAGLDQAQTATLAANDFIKAEWAKMAARYPGVGIDFSGELDDIQESLDSMLVLFLLGLGLIYLILATQFRSYWQPLMILATVPMAFTGVVFGLVVSGNPLSLYSLYGAIALVGIAVNSAIVLIDTANKRRRDGMSPLHAAVYAARRRVVPILITSSTTIGSLLSLALGLGGKSLIWGPVASAIVWGLTISTVLTLFVIPLLYRVFMRKPHVAA
ncbi:MAG: efflux RND transporter permease subunit [Pseudomonadota bacterium]|nr:efflux RND transporter permease subunit [Pseudomonadota bacterium]MDP1906122.1 efflux RND transporter permease subunit [Pseudomonadota bacterium]MDP2352581.1 efflux RND transporter permease subunit [Pseudomonadota bacterium]